MAERREACGLDVARRDSGDVPAAFPIFSPGLAVIPPRPDGAFPIALRHRHRSGHREA